MQRPHSSSAPSGSAPEEPLLPILASGVRTVPVLLPYPLAGAYDYRVPCGVDLAPGDFVEVPIGPRRVLGVVWDDAERPPAATPAVATAKTKSVLRAPDGSAMRTATRRLVRRIGPYPLTTPPRQ